MRSCCLLAVLACAGCGDLIVPSSSSDDDAAPGGDDDGGGGGTMDGAARADARDGAHARDVFVSDASAVIIVSFASSMSGITETQSTTFQLTVDDPYGLGDIASAELSDESGGSYGAFTAAGSWTLTRGLSWSDIAARESITFSPPGMRRTFIARVRDRRGNTTSSSIDLELYCAGQGYGACSSHCVSFTSTSNCGGCGRTCEAGASCAVGACQ
jgi:hypothetical protein